MKLFPFSNFFDCHKNCTSKDSNKAKCNNDYGKLFAEMNRTERECQHKKAYDLSNISEIFVAKPLHAFLILLCFCEKSIIAPAINGNEKTPNIAPTIKISPIFSIIFLKLMLECNTQLQVLQAISIYTDL
jgi:hypothetical protein